MPTLLQVVRVAQHVLYFFITSALLGWLFPVRVSGTRILRRVRGALILANHQSFLDPILVGLAAHDRIMSHVARSTLFKSPIFRALTYAYDPVALDREGFAKEGLKDALGRVQRGEGLVVYPEGTRSLDGKVLPIKPGVLLLLRRANAPVLIFGISGSFESWPKRSPMPMPTPIWVHIVPWRPPATRDTALVLASLQAALEAAAAEADRRRRRLKSRYPLAGLFNR